MIQSGRLDSGKGDKCGCRQKREMRIVLLTVFEHRVIRVDRAAGEERRRAIERGE